MSSGKHGVTSSELEVTHISKHGVWLLVGDRELFMPYDEFPWFMNAPIGGVLNVVQQGEGHLYWPDLDVDLSIESIDNPMEYPLKAK